MEVKKIDLEIKEILNTEGKYILYKGIEKEGRGNVFFKVPKGNNSSNHEILKLHHEFEIIQKLETKNIPRALGIGSHGNHVGLLMQDGHEVETLRDRMKKGFDLSVFLPIAICLAEAIDEIHRKKIIHKSIKPENILISREVESKLKKDITLLLIDFSESSQLSNERSQTKNANALEMDLRYISPEQTGRMNRLVDSRSDLYSLGVVFYEMLTGRVPYEMSDAMGMVHAHIAIRALSMIEVNKDIPPKLSDVVMKLLSKNAEERYQSSKGLKLELESCYQEWKTTGKIETFQIGSLDISDKFQISQKLYGREKEVGYLMSRFSESAVGKTQMLLVGGYSGVGKSALIHEVQKPIVEKRGYFIQGKFDQFKKNIPFSAVTQAFNGLLKQLLREPESELKIWKEKIQNAVGKNGQIVVDLFPELEQIIDKQESLLELGPQESQNRFNYTMEMFSKCFASPKHPLVIFLDDLQWSDAATLNLLKTLMISSDETSLLVIAAYRDNEVDEMHPFIKIVSEIEKNEGIVSRLILKPLDLENICEMVSDTLKQPLKTVEGLSSVVHKKTEGNPFFVCEILHALNRQEIIAFNHNELKWEWSLERVKNAGVSDNVVELMISRLRELPIETQNVVRLASCMGNIFDLSLLSIIAQASEAKTAKNLWSALEEGLLIPLGDGYKFVHDTVQVATYSEAGEGVKANAKTENSGVKLEKAKYQFLHDRVQQAAYGLIEESKRKEVHLLIGRLLVSRLSEKEIEEKLFDVVGHLNKGVELITKETEKIELSRYNLRGGELALSSAANDVAVQYFRLAESLLPNKYWEEEYELTKDIKAGLIKALMLTAQFEMLEVVAQEMLGNLKTVLERSEVYGFKISSRMIQGKTQDSIELGAKALNELGLSIPSKGSIALTLKEVFHTRIALRKWEENVSKIKLSNDPIHIAKIRILAKICDSTFTAQPLLVAAVAGAIVRLSLANGYTPLSAPGFTLYLIYAVLILKDNALAKRLAVFSEALCAHPNLDTIYGEGITKTLSATFFGWYNLSLPRVETSCLEVGERLRSNGEMLYMSHSIGNAPFFTFHMLNFSVFAEKFQPWQSFFKKSKVATTTSGNFINTYLQSMVILRDGRYTISEEGEFLWSGEYLDVQLAYKKAHEAKSVAVIALLHEIEIELAYFLGAIKQALATIKRYLPYSNAVQGLISELFFKYYSSLSSIAAIRGEAGIEEKKNHKLHRKTVKKNLEWLKKRAEWAPTNFQQKYELLKAELLDVSGKSEEATVLYEEAIKNSDKYEHLADSGLARELYGSSLWRRGKQREALEMLESSCEAYKEWGANAVVSRLEKTYPELKNRREKKELVREQSGNESLDLQAVMKASQTISGEIVLEKLLTKLMSVVMEASGADKVALALCEKEEGYIQAESNANGETQVMQSLPFEQCHTLPISVLRSVSRLRKEIVLGDASKSVEFGTDVYIRSKKVQSVLCLPILNQGKLVGVLYLENSLATDAFTIERVQLLTMLSAQAAISIENAKLYRNVQAVTAERSRIQTEMVVAQRIQTSLLPEKAELKGYEALGYMKTADEVGGDYYDTIRSGNRQFAVIGDVSGHGVTSGLVMMMAQTILHTIINGNGKETTAEILSRANVTLTQNILKLKESKYMTMILFEMKENGEVSFSGAHLDMLVYRLKTNRIERLTSIGFWLGMEDDITSLTIEQKANLSEGDILLLYTDGVTEATDSERKLFGSKRLGEVLQANSSKPLETIKHSIIESLSNYETPDDVTLLLIKKI